MFYNSIVGDNVLLHIEVYFLFTIILVPHYETIQGTLFISLNSYCIKSQFI